MKTNLIFYIFLFCGGVLGGTAVIISAWGAHGLELVFEKSPNDRFSFNYATNFQIFHSLLLIIISFYSVNRKKDSILLIITCSLTIIGILLFFFPIYLRIIFNYSNFSIVTPFGGVCFFVSWFLISAWAVFKIYLLIKDSSKS